MNFLSEVAPYISLVTVIVSSALAVALCISAKQLVGRSWLLVSAIVTLIAMPAFQIIPVLAQLLHRTEVFVDVREMYEWFDVINVLRYFGVACFAMFLFLNWSVSRMKLNALNLLFSFSGRIPRSAFWITLLILFPLGTMVGFAPFTTKANGFPLIIIWAVYVCWFAFSTWISLAVYAKRWHDCDKSGWMTLVLFIPFIGSLWLLAYLGFVPGTTGPNMYGEDPLDIRAQPGPVGLDPLNTTSRS